MSVEPLLKRSRGEHLNALNSIELCIKEISDLKVDLKQKFSTLENRIAILPNICGTIIQRIDVLETLVKSCDNHKHTCCTEVLNKLNTIEELLRGSSMGTGTESFDGEINVNRNTGSGLQSPIVLVPSNPRTQVSASVCLDSTVQGITLNTEMDFPDGSWLGDENNPECRVRCAISPANLLHINTFCQTPEKMAVTLLDYLFTREVLAVSNLSGKGKHGKKQLDPLMIYGIRCHLLYKFNIVEKEWYKIKQNMDSKCRTAWRKKVRGLPLGGFKNYTANDSPTHQLHQIISEDGESLFVTSGSYVDDSSLEEMETQVIHTAQGNIEVYATVEQLARIQEGHHIQLVTDEQTLTHMQNDTGLEGEDSVIHAGDTLTLGCGEQTVTIVSSRDVSVASIAGQLVEAQISDGQVLEEGDEVSLGNMETTSNGIGRFVLGD